MFSLVPFLGSNRYKTREFSHKILQALVIQKDDTRAVLFGVESKDPEIKSRCNKIIREYRNVPIPSELNIYDFEPYLSIEAYNHATDNNDVDFRLYSSLYIEKLFDLRFSRKEIQSHIKFAESKKALMRLKSIRNTLKRTVYYLFPILEILESKGSYDNSIPYSQ